MQKVLGLRICSSMKSNYKALVLQNIKRGRAKGTCDNHWSHKLSAYIMICSYLQISRIYCDNHLHQIQANPSHLEPSYKNQYVALSIFSNSKHTSVSRSTSPSWVTALTWKRWESRLLECLSTYTEITNSRSVDVQGGERILVKCTMPYWKR